MRLKNIKKIRGKNAVDTSYGLNGCAECKARVLLQGARKLPASCSYFQRNWEWVYGCAVTQP